MLLFEGAKISQQLLQRAISDPDFTMGIEAEFFLAGGQTFIIDHLTSGLGTRDEGGGEHFVKKLGDMDWHDMAHFFKPLGVPRSESKHDHEIMRDRLFDLYEQVTGEDSASVTPEDAWTALRAHHRVHVLMAMLRAFPEGRMMGIGDKSDAVRDIVYDGHADEIEPFGKLNELDIALGQVGYEQDDFNVTAKAGTKNSHATRDAFYNLVAKDLTGRLGTKVVYTTDSNLGYHVSNEHEHWFVTEDSSLWDTEETNDAIGVELVSPIMDAQTGLAMLDRLLEIMNEGVLGLTVVTTPKTGLHVNLGVKGKEIDPVKILVLSGDEYMAEKFSRAHNENAASIQRAVRDRMQHAVGTAEPGHVGPGSRVDTMPEDLVATTNQLLRSIKTGEEDFARAVEVLNRIKPEGKKHSINFEKLASGYVEYRNIGNTGYHKRREDVRNAVLHMIGMTYIATEPDAYRQEFLKKLYLLVQRIHQTNMERWQERQPLAASASMIGRQAGNPGGYNSPIEQYRETPYDGETFMTKYGFDAGSDTQ